MQRSRLMPWRDVEQLRHAGLLFLSSFTIAATLFAVVSLNEPKQRPAPTIPSVEEAEAAYASALSHWQADRHSHDAQQVLFRAERTLVKVRTEEMRQCDGE